MKICLLQIGYDLELQYNALKTYIPEDVVFDRFVFIDDYIKKQLKIFPRRDKKYKELLISTYENPIKNFSEFLSLFLIMISNIKKNKDILFNIEHQFKELDFHDIKYNFRKIYEMDLQNKEFLNDISIQKYDVIAIGSSDGGIYNTVMLILTIRKLFPNKKIIIGGKLFKTYKELREILIRLSLVDTFVDGDGELVLPHLIKTWTFPKEINMSVKNLNHLPLPEPGFGSFIWNEKNNAVNIYSSRGCVNNCSFCTEGIFKFKCIKAERLAEWISKSFHDHNINRIVISDNMLCPSNKYIETFYKQIEPLVGKITIVFVQIPSKNMNENIIRIMKKLDARVYIGVESFSQNILNKMGKGVTVEHNIDIIEKSLKHKMDFDLGRILLFPGETIQEFSETLKYFTKYLTKTVQSVWLNPLTIYSETPLYRNPDKYDIRFINFESKIAAIVPEVGDIIENYPKLYIDNTDPNNELYKKKYKILSTTNEILSRIFIDKWRGSNGQLK